MSKIVHDYKIYNPNIMIIDKMKNILIKNE